MSLRFADIFEGICPRLLEPSDKPVYAAMQVPGFRNYFVGKDRESLACLLVSTDHQAGRSHPPIRLESLDVQFELRCHLKKTNEHVREGNFTVIRCRDGSREITRYFLSVCEMILRMLGDHPTRERIATVVNRLATIFQKIRQPSARPLHGLFGELCLLLHSRNATEALAAWRANDYARFDFSDGDVRLDVKASGSRNRLHTFSYEQCNPPAGTIPVVASLYAEQAAGGVSLSSLMNQIEARVSSNADLVFKLHENVAATLGTSLKESLQRCYDMRLATSSLLFFNLEDVPAIRGPLPAGVSDVHFRSNLSALPPVSIETLIDRDPKFWDLLPIAAESA